MPQSFTNKMQDYNKYLAMTQHANSTAEALKAQQQTGNGDSGQRQQFSSRGNLPDMKTASATTVSYRSTSANGARKTTTIGGSKHAQSSHPMMRVGTGSSAAVVPSQLMQNAKISQSSKLGGATTFSPMKSVGPHNMASQ